MARILLLDSDRDLVDLLSYACRRAGFEVLPTYDSSTALRLIADEQADLAILEVNLNARGGFDLLRELRRRSQIPVIILTERTSEDDKVRGFELGADDYLTKPFSHRELIARARARLRRHTGKSSEPRPAEAHLKAGPITLDPTGRVALNGDKVLGLTATEFRLLHCLVSNVGSVVPTATILRQVWGCDDLGGTDVVRATMHRLRRKLGEHSTTPGLLHTVPGVGVMLKLTA